MNKPEKTIKQVCKVINVKGLHARAAAQIVTLSSRYQCELTLTHKTKSASSLSLIKLLTLDAPKGSQIEIVAKGKHVKDASNSIKQLFSSGFGELES